MIPFEEMDNYGAKKNLEPIVGVMHQMRVDDFSFSEDLARKRELVATPTSLQMQNSIHISGTPVSEYTGFGRSRTPISDN